MKTPLDLWKQEERRWKHITSQITDAFFLRKPQPSSRPVRLAYRDKQKSMRLKLEFLYGPTMGKAVFAEVQKLMRTFMRQKPQKLKEMDASFRPGQRFSEKDCILITYPDAIHEGSRDTLESLKDFADRHLPGAVNTIHILPFYPYSSDRGFSVKNYQIVKKKFGTWIDVENLGENFNLMFDGVFNHISVQSRWFQGFLKGDEEYEDYFISFPTKNSLTPEQRKKIVRPRTHDILTKFSRQGKDVYVWTTFSKDQADLNYKEPRLLLEIIGVMLLYIHHGANMIRLDAINYLWKEPGTSCTHLRQTHVIIQMFRDILDIVAPSVSLVSETNVPHAKNTSYFGVSGREAQMVYNFSLPPLVLYTMYKGSCTYLSKWAMRLKYPKNCTYFNFLASHDGIGLMPAKRVLPKKEIDFLVAEARKHGSLIQKKLIGLDREVPYELNITWWNAVNRKDEPFQVVRYLASRAIALSLKGVPGIYFHSLFGTQNDMEAFQRSKLNRDINRKNFHANELKKLLEGDTLPHLVLTKFRKMLKARAEEKAFHPFGEQKMLVPNEHVFSVLRVSPDKKERILALVNVTPQDQDYRVNCRELGLNPQDLRNVIRDKPLTKSRIIPHDFTIRLKPYEVMWLKSKT